MVAEFTKGTMNVTFSSGSTIKDIVKRKNSSKLSNTKSVVYKIPCGACDESYLESHIVEEG